MAITNYSTAVFLLNKHARAVVGVYEDETEYARVNSGRAAPRQTFKTLDETIKVGDFVLVPTNTRHKMTVNKIVEVDVDVDFESATPMAWVIATIDRSEFERVLKHEGDMIEKVKSAEKRRKQDELRDALLKQNDYLKTLEITSLNGADAPPVPLTV
jgi:hypothetical protein